MGPFGYFRRRRERESVIRDLEITVEPSAPSGEWAAADPRDIADARAAGFDISQLAQMVQMIAQATKAGRIEVHEGDFKADGTDDGR